MKTFLAALSGIAMVGLLALPSGADPLAGAGQRLALALPGGEPIQSCMDGSFASTACGEAKTRVAAGNECPAASGKYCSDETPYCCGTPGNYYCAVDVNHC